MRLLLALVAGFALSARSAIPVYLTLIGVPGSVQIAGREGDIEVLNLDQKVYLPTDASTGALTGTRKHNDLVFVKAVDVSSVELERRMLQNVVIPTALFRFYEIGDQGDEKRFYDIRLTNVRIVGVRKFLTGTVKSVGGASAQADWNEEVTLRYEKITWAFLDGNLIHTDSWNNR